MANTYTCIKTDVGNKLFEGQTVTPYFEDSNEFIINGPKPDTDHHVKKDGQYFKDHFELVGGNAK